MHMYLLCYKVVKIVAYKSAILLHLWRIKWVLSATASSAATVQYIIVLCSYVACNS